MSSLVEKSPAFISEVIHFPKSSNSRDALRVLGRGDGGGGCMCKGDQWSLQNMYLSLNETV